MKHSRTILIILLAVVTGAGLALAEETDEATEKTNEFLSPDGQFAFRYKGKSDDEKQTFELFQKASGKVVRTVAKSNPEIGPTARFDMEVLWRPDSRAFAVTARLWKRGSSVLVFMRQDATFREIKLPDLKAEIPDKEKGGKSFEHVNQLDSESAESWQEDGSLVVEIETIVDGEAGTLTATRTVVLGFDRPGKARILKSSIKFNLEKS